VRALEESLDSIISDSEAGFEKCRDALVLKEISSGSFRPALEPVDVATFCQIKWGRISNLEIIVDPAVPKWLLASLVLLKIILENAIHNAMQHGKKRGHVNLSLSMLGASSLFIKIENEAGKNHAAALKMQTQHGKTAIMGQHQEVDLSSIGSSSSTFLGMGEMREAAALMSATLSLDFYPQSGLEAPRTVFSLTANLLPTSAPEIPDDEGEVPALKQGCVLICADDDVAPRIGYKGLIKKLKPMESMILGETHAEAAYLVETVLAAAKEHGDEKVVCICDQNMEYDQGVIRGTEVVADLRLEGFTGVFLIRSANDDAASGLQYRKMGANGYLSKKTKMKELAASVVRECEHAWKVLAL
jgi:CheY-like chemotaxis protein